ncbi:hypothetical protein FE810_02135 [Thalassotalea litorea]|uniref:Uncharacterized protein n=1 Tax=Thalassotalea litorea TaxID=2020715 RepID=A0A5R9ISS7_9GAMM|nr:hypothetical protein [Thalassotalea litorea]TLU67107.1 hypothetical protein FE810_02135 [Thalassotalea litorea]
MMQRTNKLRWIMVLFILWLHVSLIDLFLISSSGAKLLLQQNLTFKTIIVHISVAALATLVIWSAHRLQLMLCRRKQ